MERIGSAAFSGDRLNQPGRWVVCFAADWCPFCRRFVPEFSKVEAPAGVTLAIVDLTDLESPLWETFDVKVVPTLAIFDEGRMTWRRNGHLGRGLGSRDLRALAEELRPKD